MTTTELVAPDVADPRAWPGVEVRSYVPELEVLPRAKGGDGRTVTGILVPYGQRQLIHEGLEEMFRRGAANHQLRAPNRMKFAREHLRFGGKLIGRAVELRDDAAGLWGALRASRTPDGDEVLTLVEDGALDELSVGFRARQQRVHKDGLVERTKVDILETAVVIQGAYGRGARITGLRSVLADAGPTWPDLEDRDEADEHERHEAPAAPGRSADDVHAALAFRRSSAAGRIAAGLKIR